FPFAEVGLARVDLVKAQLVRTRRLPQGLSFWDSWQQGMEEARRVQEERKPFLDAAEKALNETRARYPGISVAAEVKGEVNEERRDRRAAAEQFGRAIELDPHNAVAYLWFSRTVRGRDQKRLYSRISRQ